MKNRVDEGGFIQVIIILLALVLVAAGAYYFGTTKNKVAPTPVASVQPSSSSVTTSDPTANWKTYINTGTGISFKYPDTILIEDSVPNKTLYIGFKSAVKQFENSGGDSGSPDFIFISYNQPLKNYYEVASDSKLVEKKTMVLDGKEATVILEEFVGPGEGFNSGDRITRVLVKDSTSWTGIELQDQTQKQLFDQILSTFQFTK